MGRCTCRVVCRGSGPGGAGHLTPMFGPERVLLLCAACVPYRCLRWLWTPWGMATATSERLTDAAAVVVMALDLWEPATATPQL